MASAIPILRQVIRNFETTPDKRVGAIALVPLSQLRGQCSVYPLALSDPTRDPKISAIQPLLIDDYGKKGGRPIGLKDDLCDRKGSYYPNVPAFQSGQYPLGYPIAVIYPADNRRALKGQKFADLMQTQEGQRLLNEAGLVPLNPPTGGQP